MVRQAKTETALWAGDFEDGLLALKMNGTSPSLEPADVTRSDRQQDSPHHGHGSPWNSARSSLHTGMSLDFGQNRATILPDDTMRALGWAEGAVGKDNEAG